ncbi:MAG: TerB family tellurite resistance protein [Parvularculaceae bacterium]
MELVIVYLIVGAAALAVSRRMMRRQREKAAALAAECAPPDLSNLQDPREAAAVFLYRVAAAKGDMSDARDDALLEGMQELFGGDADAAEDFLAFGWRADGDGVTPLDAVAVAGPMMQRCTHEERRDFIAALRKIAAVDGPPNDAQRRLMSQIEAAVLPSS